MHRATATLLPSDSASYVAGLLAFLVNSYLVAGRVSPTRTAVGFAILLLAFSHSGFLASAVASRRERAGVGMSLILAAATLRLDSFIWPSTIDWDENTFLTVARRALEGELPYTTTFDNKGPMSVLFNAAALGMSFDSLVVFRLALVVLIGLSGYAVFITVHEIGGRNGDAGLAAVLFVVLSSSIPTAGLWHTAHTGNTLIVLVFFVLARFGSSRPATLGVLLAALVLTRANYGFTVVATWVTCLAIAPQVSRNRFALRSVLGGTATLLVVAAVYATQGALDRLFSGLVTVNLAQGHGVSGFSNIGKVATYLVSVQLFAAFLAFAGNYGRPNRSRMRITHMSIVITAASSATALSVSLSEVVYGHHALLLVAFPALQIGVLMTTGAPHGANQKPPRSRAGLLRPVTFAAAIALLLNSIPSDVFSIDRDGFQAESDVVTAVEEARAQSPGGLWALTDHYVYWRLRELPIHALVTHPSSISKPGFLATVHLPGGPASDATEAVLAILELKPGVVVTRADMRHGYLDASASVALKEALRRNYCPTSEVGRVMIWVICADG